VTALLVRFRPLLVVAFVAACAVIALFVPDRFSFAVGAIVVAIALLVAEAAEEAPHD
jgi:hypothetical protein